MTIREGWKRVPIATLYEGLYDGPHGTPPVSEAGPIFLGIGNITEDGHLDLSTTKHIASFDFPKWTKRVTPRGGDIVFTYEATLNRYAIIPAQFDGCLGRRLALIRPDPNKVDTRFLHYSFFSADWRETIERNRLAGATVDRIPLSKFPTFPINVPDLPVQRRIAGVLSAYDDLIEVNQRRIAILEEMARRLFDEWFVRFRYPGHEHVKIVDGLPEGWERRALGEVAEIRLGKMLDAKKNRGELRPYLANVNVRWGAFDLTDLREMRVEENERAKYGLSFGDTVMCEGGEPGRCALWKAQVSEMTIQKALHRIRALDELDPIFLYHQLSYMAKTRQLEGLFTGATIKHLPREKLIQAMIVVPPPKLMREFAALAAPIEAQIGTLGDANSRAAQARDLLLPKLISGEIDVGRAEEALARAAE